MKQCAGASTLNWVVSRPGMCSCNILRSCKECYKIERFRRLYARSRLMVRAHSTLVRRENGRTSTSLLVLSNPFPPPPAQTPLRPQKLKAYRPPQTEPPPLGPSQPANGKS